MSPPEAFIPIFRPQLPPVSSYLHRLKQIDLSRQYSNGGAQSEELIRRFADHFGVDCEHVVLGSNATALLTGAAYISGAEDFLCPSWTFAATPLALLNSGRKLTFVDVDPRTQVAKFPETSTATGVIIVAPFGSRLTVGAELNGFGTVVIDAAASIANPVSFSEDFSNISRVIEVYSLHATKVLGIGEGGVAIVRNQRLADELRAWTNFGFRGSRESVLLGANAKMSEFSAAVGCEALANSETEFQLWTAARRKARAVEAALGLEGFSPPDQVAPYWIVNLPMTVSAGLVSRRLADFGIDSRRWWSQGCHRMRALSSIRTLGGLPGTDHVARHTIGLPFFLDFDQKSADRIHDALREILMA